MQEKLNWDPNKKPVVFNQDGNCWWCDLVKKVGYPTCLNAGTVGWYRHELSMHGKYCSTVFGALWGDYHDFSFPLLLVSSSSLLPVSSSTLLLVSSSSLLLFFSSSRLLFFSTSRLLVFSSSLLLFFSSPLLLYFSSPRLLFFSSSLLPSFHAAQMLRKRSRNAAQTLRKSC
jgi:hypothetical protein